MRRIGVLYAACVAVCVGAGVASANEPVPNLLDAYLAREQPAYSWEVQEERELLPGVQLYQVELVSQVWRGITWTHRVNLVVPPLPEGDRARPGHALLFITGSGGEDRTLEVLGPLALMLGAPVAVLHDVPNQPLFQEESDNGRGLREDALIAHTFVQFLETQEPDWPLLFPMARSAVAAMDFLGEFSAQQGEGWEHGVLEQFVTTGASKRGWTTWLSAVVDERVIGIAPIVYDNLNIREQIRHHFRSWGAPSRSIHDYTERGLLELIEHPDSDMLLAAVDPYEHADRIQVPKLVCLGTNDSYWPIDAIQLYQDDLRDEFFCHYVPNAGHRAGMSVVNAVNGFFDYCTGRIGELPELRMTIHPEEGASLRVEADDFELVRSARLWSAHVEDRDFRESTWHETEAELGFDGWEASFPDAVLRDTGNAAFLFEVELLDSSGAPFLIHTPVQVWQLGTQP